MDRSRLPKVFGPTAAAILAHAAVVWGVPFLLRSVTDSVQASVVHAQAMFSGHAATDRWNQLGAVLGTLGNEWFLAFAPMSIVCVTGIFLERTRLMSLGLAISLIPYLTVSVAMLAGYNEYGAYLLPLAFPVAWITMRCYSGHIVLVCAVLAAIASVVMVKLNDDPGRGREYADGLRTVAEGQPMALLIGEYVDLEARFLHLPETPYLHLTEIAQFSREEVAALMPQLDGVLERWFVEGRRIFLTDRVEAVVQSQTFAGYENLDQVILGHLRTEYELTPVEHDAFSGKEVRRK